MINGTFFWQCALCYIERLTNSSLHVPEKCVSYHMKLHKNNEIHTIDNHTRNKTKQNYAKVCGHIFKYMLYTTECETTKKYWCANPGYHTITDLFHEIKQQLFMYLCYLCKQVLDHSLGFIMHCNYTLFLCKNMNNTLRKNLYFRTKAKWRL